jgi:catechol 2,3-dioxygenase-like lactoylglutathione lyase family enzyme
MSDDNPSIMSHISIGTVGAKRVMEHPGAVAYGKQYPEFWVQTPINESAATTGNGTHFGFTASSKEAVQAFYDAAMAAGATDDGQPGPRPLYGERYYGCFVHDPDGHKIESTFWDMVLAEKLGMA